MMPVAISSNNPETRLFSPMIASRIEPSVLRLVPAQVITEATEALV